MTNKHPESVEEVVEEFDRWLQSGNKNKSWEQTSDYIRTLITTAEARGAERERERILTEINDLPHFRIWKKGSLLLEREAVRGAVTYWSEYKPEHHTYDNPSDDTPDYISSQVS